MLKFPFILFLVLLNTLGISQNCLPEGISFSSQAQVDGFKVLYPGCTHIVGDLRFELGSDIISFDSLDHIETIEGYLEIRSISDQCGLTLERIFCSTPD